MQNNNELIMEHCIPVFHKNVKSSNLKDEDELAIKV